MSTKINTTVTITALLLMLALTATNFFGLSLAGFSIFVGIIAFFLTTGKGKICENGLDFRATGKQLADKKLWLWILFPTLANLLSVAIAHFFLPEFLSHVAARTGEFLTFDKILLLVLAFQLIITALGEEIAWRAFFQKRLGGFIPMWLSIVLTSILFSLGHLSTGTIKIVIYDLLFVFVNSLFYGIVFKKTNNACISAISHLIANLVAAAIIFLV